MDSRLLLVKLFGTTFLFDDALSTPWIFTTFARFLSNNKRCFDEPLLTITGSIALRHTYRAALCHFYTIDMAAHKNIIKYDFFHHSYHTVWKFRNFPAVQIFTWNWFWRIKNINKMPFMLTFLVALNLEFSEFSQIFRSDKPKSKFRKSKLGEMALFETLNWPKLISRKIWITEKSSNFHTVYHLRRLF